MTRLLVQGIWLAILISVPLTAGALLLVGGSLVGLGFWLEARLSARRGIESSAPPAGQATTRWSRETRGRAQGACLG